MHGLGRGRRIWAAFLILPARAILCRPVGIPSGTSPAAYFTNVILVAKSKMMLVLHLHVFILSVKIDFVTRIQIGQEPFNLKIYTLTMKPREVCFFIYLPVFPASAASPGQK
jgi:hypothetical protein